MNEEDRRQRQYTLIWTFLILAALLGTYLLYASQYQHPAPEVDCSQAYDYPICVRALTPEADGAPGATTVFIAMLAVSIACLALIILSYKASVVTQRSIVVTSQGSAPPAVTRPATVVPQPKEIQELPRLQELDGKDAWGHPIPKTILNNDIPPGKIKPPAKKPSKGVDAGELK